MNNGFPVPDPTRPNRTLAYSPEQSAFADNITRTARDAYLRRIQAQRFISNQSQPRTLTVNPRSPSSDARPFPSTVPSGTTTTTTTTVPQQPMPPRGPFDRMFIPPTTRNKIAGGMVGAHGGGILGAMGGRRRSSFRNYTGTSMGSESGHYARVKGFNS